MFSINNPIEGVSWTVRQYFKSSKTPQKMYSCSPVSDKALLLDGFKIPPFVLGVRVRCRRMSMDQWLIDTEREKLIGDGAG